MGAESLNLFEELVGAHIRHFDRAEGEGSVFSFEREEKLEFVFENERIDKNGSGLGIDDATGFGVEFFGGESGAFGGEMIGKDSGLFAEFSIDGFVEQIALSLQVFETGTAISFAFADLLVELGDRGVFI